MTKEVLLSLKGLQMEQGDGAEELETITPARYYHKNGSHYIVYEEMTEGFSDTTRIDSGSSRSWTSPLRRVKYRPTASKRMIRI